MGKKNSDPTNKGKWKIIYEDILERYGGKMLFNCKVQSKDTSHIGRDNIFLNNVVKAWSKINYSNKNESVSKEIIWNNTNIKHQNKTIFFKEWYDRGIIYVEQLYDYRAKRFLQFTEVAEYI